MSETIISQLITAAVTIVTAVLVFLTNRRVNKIASKVAEVNHSVDTVGSRVVDLDIKVDGRLTQLLEVSKSDSKREGLQEAAVDVTAASVLAATALGKLQGIEQAENKKMRCVEVFVLDDNADDIDFIKRATARIYWVNFHFYVNEDELLMQIGKASNIYIIDHFLIKTTGIEILKKIKKINVKNFVIAFSGQKNTQMLIDYTNSGVDRFLDKSQKGYEGLLNSYIEEGIRQLSRG